jgi:hypothetical protein
MGGMTPVTAAAQYGTRVKLSRALTRQRQLRTEIRNQPRWSTKGRSRQDAALLRGDLREHLAALRAAGTLLDTIDVLAAFGIRAELTARGWDRTWEPVPAEAVEWGRWPGSPDTGTPERIPLRLPSELVTQVQAACWWTSAAAIRDLRDWRDRHPDLLLGVRPDEEPLVEYRELSRRVTTTGVIWRAGIKTGILAADPTGDTGISAS